MWKAVFSDTGEKYLFDSKETGIAMIGNSDGIVKEVRIYDVPTAERFESLQSINAELLEAVKELLWYVQLHGLETPRKIAEAAIANAQPQGEK